MWFMIKVTFGEHDRCNDNKRPESRFVLRAVAGAFSFLNFDNDIALLRLNDRVPITKNISPICLPKLKGWSSWSKLSASQLWLLCNCRRIIYEQAGNSSWLGDAERRWQAIVFAARSASSSPQQRRLQENELLFQNDLR